MQIQSGKLFVNKTWLYLYPSLRFYGEDLLIKLNYLIKLAVGIKDYNIQTEDNCIYILIDTKPFTNKYEESIKYTKQLTKILEWLREQFYYKTDYIYTGINETYPKHMIVLKLPKVLDKTLESFKKGSYSKMYSKEQLNRFFIKPAHKTSLEVLTKNPSRIKTFVDIVNKDFNTNITVEDYKDAELDYPPEIFFEESFNFKIN